MERNFVQSPGYVSVQDLVDRGLTPAKSRFAIVTTAGSPSGMVTFPSIREVPREAWPSTPASQVMVPFQKLATTQPNAVLWSALEKMGRDGVNQLPVLDANGVVGVLSREDIVHYLSGLRAMAA